MIYDLRKPVNLVKRPKRINYLHPSRGRIAYFKS